MSVQERHTATGEILGVAAGADGDAYWVNPHPQTLKVEKIYFTPTAAITANDTNYATLSVDAGSTEVGTESTTTADTGNLVAGTPIEIVLTGTGTGLEVAQGEAVHFKKRYAGTGAAAVGQFQVALSVVRV